MVTGVKRRPAAGGSLRNIAMETFRGFRADRGLDLAGSLSFSTLLTAVPLLATFSLDVVLADCIAPFINELDGAS